MIRANVAKRAQTRRRLLDAGTAVIAERGVEGTTIGEITARAGVAGGTFYNYFPTRDELVAALVGEYGAAVDRMAAEVAALPTGAAVRLAVGLIELIETAGGEQPAGAAFVEVVRTVPALRERLAHLVDGAASAVCAEAGASAAAAGSAVTDAVLGVALEAVRSRLAGRTPPGSAVGSAALVLRMLGVRDAEGVAHAAARVRAGRDYSDRPASRAGPDPVSAA